MKKKNIVRISICTLVIMSFLLTSCSKKIIERKTELSETKFDYDEYMDSIEEYKYFKERPVKANEVLLYNVDKENLGIYNTDTNTWKEIYDSSKNNLTTYAVKGQEQKDVFYTMGSSSYNDFSVVKFNQENRMVESLLDVTESDSVLPIGMHEDKLYFIHNKNDLGDNETRSIAYMDGDKLVDVIDFKDELVTNAAIIGNKLYFVAFAGDKFVLYSCTFDNYENNKELEISSDQIFRYKDELVYVNENKELVSLNNEKIFKLKDHGDIDVLSDYGLLIQSYMDEHNNFACDVIDPSDNSVIETVSKFYGYNICDGILELYCEGSMKEVKLNKLKK